MTSNKKQLELGYAGLALLRNRLIGNGKVTDGIVNEISNLTREKSELQASISTTEEIKKYSVPSGYKKWSKTYDTIPNLLLEVEEAVTKSILNEFKIGKALDAACGTGRYSKILSSLGHEVTGIDSSTYMLKGTKAHAPKATFIQGGLENLPLEDGSFDLTMCALALTHFPSIHKVLNELTRVTRKGGYIVLSDIHPWFVILGGQAEFQDINGKKGFVFNHVHLISQYLDEFKKLGLKVDLCLEPTLDSKYLDPKEIGLDITKTTMNTALEGLPLVLIWKLEKI
jgi:ubiquinone/menaquinone biosynthesis C-methylase UbiE